MERVEYEAGGRVFVWTPTRADHDLTTALADDRCWGAIALLAAPFLAAENPRVVDRPTALAAAGRIVEAIEGDPRLPARYAIDAEIAPGTRLEGVSGVSGIRLDGREGGYSIRAGKGFCMLFENARISPTAPMLAGGVDLRGRTELATANMGVIAIRSRRWSLPGFAAAATGLRDFLAGSDAGEVSIRFVGVPSVD